MQPIVQVLAKTPVLHQMLQVHIGGRDDPDVDLHGLDAAQTHELPLLDHTEQLGLRLERHAADLVEEDAALVRELEQPLLGRDRAGERAPDVTKQIRLEQIRRQTAGVDGDERPVDARRIGMHRPGHQFLAGAALSLHEDGRAARRRLAHQVEHALHAGTPADDVAEAMRLRLQALAQRAVLGHEPTLRDRIADDHEHVVVLERLFDEVKRAAFEGLPGVARRAEGRDHDHRQLVVHPLELFERLDAVDPGHHHVDDRGVEALALGRLQPLLPGLRQSHPAPLAGQERLEDLPHDLLVVDDENGRILQHVNAPPGTTAAPRWPTTRRPAAA